ncbi:MAG TPA: hypothetical protein VFQ58_10965, partial [Flavisolibacter sp.]|nr:hypothetical protein [Flavisolibacter sp.]
DDTVLKAIGYGFSGCLGFTTIRDLLVFWDIGGFRYKYAYNFTYTKINSIKCTAHPIKGKFIR